MNAARRVLITGCDGFLGRHLVAEARAAGLDALGLHRSGPAGEGRVRVDLGDAADTRALDRALERCDAVIHAAANVRFGGRRRDLVAENVLTTERVVRAAERAGAPPVVLVSSASVLFRPGEQLGLTEDAPLPRRALGGYAASKARSEAVLADYPGRSVILRPQAMFGPGDRALVPRVVEAARRGPFVWVGPPGVQADLVSVHDVAAWAVRAATDGRAHGVYHLTAGEPRPLEPLVRRMLERFGLRAGHARVPRPVAGALGTVVGGTYALLAPHREPPLTRFAAETFGATRTLDPTRTFSELGRPRASFDAAFDAMLRGLHAPRS